MKSFSPATSTVTTESGRDLGYDALVVATGLKIKWDAIRGLPEALSDPKSGVSSIYSYDTCDKVWNDVEKLGAGQAVFTQPAGVIKCAGGKYVLFNTLLWTLSTPPISPAENHVDGMGQISKNQQIGQYQS